MSWRSKSPAIRLLIQLFPKANTKENFKAASLVLCEGNPPVTHDRWRHQMETCSALLTLCEGNPSVTGRFLSQRPGCFGVFFDVCLNKRLSKQSRRRWFESPWRICVNKGWVWALNMLKFHILECKYVRIESCSLKRKCCHFDENVVIGCTESSHFDNFQCSQWWKFRQNDSSVSVCG